MLSSFFKARTGEQTLYPGKPSNGEFLVRQSRLFRQKGVASKKGPYKQNALIKIKDLGVILLGFLLYTH